MATSSRLSSQQGTSWYRKQLESYYQLLASDAANANPLSELLDDDQELLEKALLAGSRLSAEERFVQSCLGHC